MASAAPPNTSPNPPTTMPIQPIAPGSMGSQQVASANVPNTTATAPKILGTIDGAAAGLA